MASEYAENKIVERLPRVPYEGFFDMTYRCNNNCRHCWISIPADAKEKEKELSFEEIRRIVDEAKAMGCRRWLLSGGEPMLRPDFADIFDYITRNGLSYSLNTNGTLITPKLAKLLQRKGSKLVALYGATPDVHDYITRRPGSFEAMRQGIAYLKEAGAGFIVQIVPMRSNYHQFRDMVGLARSLSRHYRLGARWLYLSACGDQKKNEEILSERLLPNEIMEIDKPDLSYVESPENNIRGHCPKRSRHLFFSCIAGTRSYYIDPYGRMTFCCFMKEPSFFYDLRKGDFRECWEEYIPSLAKKVKAAKSYTRNCMICDLRRQCSWCPAYGYLEHRSFSAKVGYLCGLAKEQARFIEKWRKEHRRYYRIAGITLQVSADVPITNTTFEAKFRRFEIKRPGKDLVSIMHYFSFPDLEGRDLGRQVYHRPPWAIYKRGGAWIYVGISAGKAKIPPRQVAVFNHNYTRAVVYNTNESVFLKGGMNSLLLFPTDQIFLAPILTDRQACFIHSCGINFDGKGFLFAGRSGAGKSTMATILKGKARILCDDRVIVRRHPRGFKIHGTWSHGDVKEVSAASAPLKAIFFLSKSENNYAEAIKDKNEVIKRLLSCVIKPLVTVDWWRKTLSLVEMIAGEVPCYTLHFDTSGRVVDTLKNIF